MMPGHKQLKINISRRSRNALERHVCQTYQIPTVEGRYRDIVISEAVIEFLDHDRSASVEERVRALDETLADRCEAYSRVRRSDDRVILTDDGLAFDRHDLNKWRPYMSEELHDDLQRFVDELNAERSDAETNISYSAVIDLAIHEYCDGGRDQRVTDRLGEMQTALDSPAIEIVSADASASDAAETAADPDGSDDADDYPYFKKDRVARVYETIVDELGIDSIEDCGGVPRSILLDAIDQWCTKRPDDDRANDKTRQEYIDRVCEDLDLVESGNGQTFTERTEVTETTPAFERKDAFADLDCDERVEAVRVKLLRKADRRTNATTAQATAADIREWFDDEPTPPHAVALQKAAVDGEVFTAGKRVDGEQTVQVALARVTDVDLLRMAGLDDRAAAVESGDDEQDRETVMVEAEAEMDRQMRAEPIRIDGGHDLDLADHAAADQGGEV